MKLGAALAALVSIILALAAASQSARPPALLTYSAGEPVFAPEGLCIAKPNGTSGLRLLRGRKDDRDSAWSPGGKYVAFARYSERTTGAISQIYLADARGHIIGNLTRPIRGFQGFNVHPAWSPDGRRIAFESSWRGSVIYIVDRKGTNLLRSGIFGEDPQWTRDGSRIIFTRDFNFPPYYNTYIADRWGGDERLLIEHAHEPSLSRDGKRIAFVRALDIWVADADGTGAKPLIKSATGAQQPAWSPDGTRIAFERAETLQSSRKSVVVVNADSGQELAVVRGPSGAYAPSWRPAVTLPRASRPACN